MVPERLPNPIPQEKSESIRYEALLHMADLMATHVSLPEFVRELSQRVRGIFSFHFVNLSMHDPLCGMMRSHLWEGREPELTQRLFAVEESVTGCVWKTQQTISFSDVSLDDSYPEIFRMLRSSGIRSYCAVPLTAGLKRLGAIAFGSCEASAYGEADLRFLRRLGEFVAQVVENVENRRMLDLQRDRLNALLEVSRSLVSALKLEDLLPRVSQSIAAVVEHDFAGLASYDPETKGMTAVVLASPRNHQVIAPGETIPLSESLAGEAFVSGQPVHFDLQQLTAKAQSSRFAAHVLSAGIQSMYCIPLNTTQGTMGTLNLGSTRHTGFTPEEQGILANVAAQLAIALENARAFQEIGNLKDRLEKEKLYLESEIRTTCNFEEIVGGSMALRQALSQAEIVAPSDATVLILGETGTGKELIARAIHRMSRRKENSFIKLNCAAIPTGLLESELFGHEKGAFTGALSQKLGRLELADKGTLFLDEVGDIPLELQPKLLRVLQDQEFERLGSNRTMRINVRLIAATNRNLEHAIAERQFRSDLYYRLRVFPVTVPPLRQRKEDIPDLVRYFVRKFARRMDKRIEIVPSETLAAFQRWHWPGNIRELENFLERCVILTEGEVLHAPISELEAAAPNDSLNSLEAAEREHIVHMMKQTRGVLSGPNGAAERLGLKRTTLQSKIQRFGIGKGEYSSSQPSSHSPADGSASGPGPRR